ncbi:hypothetical protein LJB80_00260, partial [Bacteroides sp. OttesenSCG-928-F21]|nr:hypothetical protein [Bacteroides sp. OttesenSCG-928-F21]
YVSSLYEPLVDNFVDSLWDWFDEGKNALDSFKGYASQTFRDIVSDMMRTIILKNVVDGFDKDIADLYEDYAENKMTEEELMAAVAKRTEGLIGSYEDNIPQLQSLMARVAEMFKNAGIDLKDIDAESQSGRAGAITTISQDTGNRLEGIGTSMQMHCANIDDGVENINDALGTALGHLRRIEEHTGVSAQALAEIREQIERLIRELV